MRACTGVRVPPPARDLVLVGVASGLALSLIGLGLLSMRGAVADVIRIMDGLPPVPGPDEEQDRRASRSAVVEEYRHLLFQRCLPGLFLVAVGAGWLSYGLWGALR